MNKWHRLATQPRDPYAILSLQFVTKLDTMPQLERRMLSQQQYEYLSSILAESRSTTGESWDEYACLLGGANFMDSQSRMQGRGGYTQNLRCFDGSRVH